MILADIKAGEVVNLIEVDPQQVPEWAVGWPEAASGVAIGHKYAGGKFSVPVVAATAPAREEMQLTRRQVFIGMAAAGLITQAEAVAVATVGTVPAAINAAILSLPADQRTPAYITFGMFQTAYRSDPMVALFQATAGMTDTQMDAFFVAYAGI